MAVGVARIDPGQESAQLRSLVDLYPGGSLPTGAVSQFDNLGTYLPYPPISSVADSPLVFEDDGYEAINGLDVWRESSGSVAWERCKDGGRCRHLEIRKFPRPGWAAVKSAIEMMKENKRRRNRAGLVPAVSLENSAELEARYFSLLEDYQRITAEALDLANANMPEKAGDRAADAERVRDEMLAVQESLYSAQELDALATTFAQTELFQHYWKTSVIQFVADEMARDERQSASAFASVDGIVPFTEARLRQREFERAMLAQVERDRLILEELRIAGLEARELVDASRELATDPISRDFVADQVDEIIPPSAAPSAAPAGPLSGVSSNWLIDDVGADTGAPEESFFETVESMRDEERGFLLTNWQWIAGGVATLVGGVVLLARKKS